LVLVVMNIAYSLTAYPAGRLSDRLGRYALLILGLIMLIVADLFLAQAQNLWLVFVGTAFWGFYLGLTQGLISALIADAISPQERGIAFGVFGLISGLALLLASLLAGWLWQNHGGPATFWGGAVIAALALIGFINLLRNKNGLTENSLE
jgi:MFS family permease